MDDTESKVSPLGLLIALALLAIVCGGLWWVSQNVPMMTILVIVVLPISLLSTAKIYEALIDGWNDYQMNKRQLEIQARKKAAEEERIARLVAINHQKQDAEKLAKLAKDYPDMPY